MKNMGGDAPFGGAYGDALDPGDLFPDRQTDRIMAFDVVVPLSNVPDNFGPGNLPGYGGVPSGSTTRRVADIASRQQP
jgi:spore coat protein A